MTALPALAQGNPPGLVSAELLPGWVTADGARMTALDVRLEPGWKTYWRSPGDAGIPPAFDWQGSANLGRVEMLWPLPEVIDSGGERTLGYHERLVLPIRIAPARPGAPVELRAEVEMGICEDICVPVSVSLRADPPRDAPDPLIEAALARLPVPADLQPACRIREIEDGMRVTALLPETGRAAGDEVALELRGSDVWVSAPELRDEGGRMAVEADFVAASGKPFPLDPDDLRLTLIGARDAIELQGCAEVQG